MLRYNRFRFETRRTSLGNSVRVWVTEPAVPRLDDRILDCSVYLYPTVEDAQRGERAGGSGFLAALPLGKEFMRKYPDFKTWAHCYAVSNRHVVIGSSATRRQSPVVRLNTHDGRSDAIPLTAADWVTSEKHDIAVVPLDLLRAHKFLSIPVAIFLTEDLAAQWDIGLGDDVFMFGRFVTHDGKQKNSPSVRFGNISMMPTDDVYHPSNESQTQESFLIEVHSISGYSGSPVLVRAFQSEKFEVMPTNPRIPSLPRVPRGPFLLGVEWGYINTHDQSQNNTGICGVVPTWHVSDLLQTRPKLLENR